ncbi:MAG TPA: DUF397 domain-containing protein [Candidatus Saccharimonadales bacterium]|nr:DUF397 domain-containing protein [Candidatus Saccharimonadales bacterium]
MNKEESQYSKKQKIVLDGVFRKSSMCGGGNCVEVARNANKTIKVRATKDRAGTVLTFTHGEWIAFLQGVRNGEFDVT